MPAVNPRITITVQPTVHALLRRMSDLTGNSQSALVGDLLSESVPIFERMVRILEAADRLKAEGRAAGEAFKDGLAQAQARVEEQLGLVLESLDGQEGNLLDAAESISRRRGRSGGATPRTRSGQAALAPPTPISNRGVTTPPKGQKGKSKSGGKLASARGGKRP